MNLKEIITRKKNVGEKKEETDENGTGGKQKNGQTKNIWLLGIKRSLKVLCMAKTVTNERVSIGHRTTSQDVRTIFLLLLSRPSWMEFLTIGSSSKQFTQSCPLSITFNNSRSVFKLLRTYSLVVYDIFHIQR